MDLESAQVAAWLVWLGHALCWPTVAVAAARAEWRALGEHGRLHVYLGTITALLLIWQLRAGEPPGPYLHLLGAALLTLVFGWRLAIVATAVLVLGTTAAGAGSWATTGLNVVLCGVVPVSVANGVERAAARTLPRNPVVYVLVCGFAGAALAMLATGVLSAAAIWAGTDVATDRLVDHYIVFYLLLLYPEGFVTGGILVWLAMFYPHWVRSYRDPEG